MDLLETVNEMYRCSAGVTFKRYLHFIDKRQYDRAYALLLCLLFTIDNLFCEIKSEENGENETHNELVGQLREEKLKLEVILRKCLSSSYNNN
jgi:hypothetical protein